MIARLPIFTGIYPHSSIPKPQANGLYRNADYIEAIANEPSRSLLGPRQESWFHRSLRTSTANTHLIATQVLFADLNLPLYGYNLDTWAGSYRSARNRTLETLVSNNITNTIFLAGDAHANWAGEIFYEGKMPAAVEFGVTGVTSPSPLGQNVTETFAGVASGLIVQGNRESAWSEMWWRGYMEVGVSKKAVDAKYIGVKIGKGEREEKELARFQVPSVGKGKGRLTGTWEAGRGDEDITTAERD